MLVEPAQIAPARTSEILKAAEAAARAVPPAFPLDATVAVNPFLGQTGEDLATASARLARVAGVRATRTRAAYAGKVAAGAIGDEDLAGALAACRAPNKPRDLAALKAALAVESPPPRAAPTLAELAARATGTDWPAIVTRSLGLWASSHFDRGQALWTPTPGKPAFAAWREWATHDLTPELAGLDGFCSHVATCPDTPERAILRAAEALGLGAAAAETAFHRLLMDLGGWAQHARWLLWEAEREGGTDATITDLLAVRLVWEEALSHHAGAAVAEEWRGVVAEHAAPLAPTADRTIDAILQEASERAYQRELAARLPTTPSRAPGRPALQAAFCIDVRSEPIRRALEGVDACAGTIGFAGFFGLPVEHRAHGSGLADKHLPVLLNAALRASSQAEPAVEDATRIRARAVRAWGRFRQAAVSSFAFVEAAGPFYALKLLGDGLARGKGERTAGPAPRLEPALDAAAKAETAATVLKAMSLTRDHARLVLLVGHGASVANNPHESAYQCGACGGHSGEVSARLLAALLNDPEARAGLPAHGVALPEDTLFVAALHDTTTDAVTLFEDAPSPGHADDLARARTSLASATLMARAERARRLPGATPETVAARAHDWSEVRPEWGLAGCAAFVAAPRAPTQGTDLGGRAFLHSYDWRADEGFSTLELILTAPVVVASWIALQYYGSAVAPEAFSSGNKLIHNVTGGIGVVQGNGGRLRAGLPWQAVHDGAGLAHEPLRLTVLVEAPQDAIAGVLARHASVRALFDNGWLHLLALEEGRVAARYRPGLAWEGYRAIERAAA